MAVITPTIVKIARGVMKITWALLENGDTGKPYDANAGCPAHPDKCVQMTGVAWGSGGSVTMQGSNDEALWFTLTDPQDNAITATGTDELEQILENPSAIRLATPKIII